MKLKDINLKEDNHFIAMEYYYLILNRTFLVIKEKGYLIGIQGNGLIGVEGGNNILARELSEKNAIKGDLSNPYSYLRNSYLEQIEHVDLLDGSLTTLY